MMLPLKAPEFISGKIKSILSNLKRHYQSDLLIHDQAGYEGIGTVIFNKLPTLVQRGLITMLNTNYPTLKQIFNNTSNVIITLALTKPKYQRGDNSQGTSNTTPSKSSLNTHKSSAPTLTNLHTKSKGKVY